MADHKEDAGVGRQDDNLVKVIDPKLQQRANLNGKLSPQMKTPASPEGEALAQSQHWRALVVHWPPAFTITSNRL